MSVCNIYAHHGKYWCKFHDVIFDGMECPGKEDRVSYCNVTHDLDRRTSKCTTHGTEFELGKSCPSSGLPNYDEKDRHSHTSGAYRSEVAPFYSAIPPNSQRRVALRSTGAPRGEKLEVGGREYEGGSLKYGYGNWMKGLPMEDTLNHIYEHLAQWREEIEKGNVPREDHLAAVAWGVLMPLMTFELHYAIQHSRRTAIQRKYPGWTAEEVDQFMMAEFDDLYMIQALAPAKK